VQWTGNTLPLHPPILADLGVSFCARSVTHRSDALPPVLGASLTSAAYAANQQGISGPLH
jgi:hypothetical protein